MPSRRVLILVSIALAVVCLIAYLASSPSTPGIAAVKKNMTSEQLELSDPIVNSVGMVFVPVPAGEFQMGTPIQKPNKKKPKQKPKLKGPDMPQHMVKITRPFYFGVCEVTQQQYEAVMGESPWAGKPLIKVGPNYAASYITWNKANEFCKKLSEQEACQYRLPTEAEWEYACRAGTQTTYSFGDDSGQLADHGWFDENAYKQDNQHPHIAGQKTPNPWSLFDMHGNVWEWCQDRYGDYTNQEATDPQGPEKGRRRVWRGGSFADARVNTRSATRISYGRRDYRPDYLAGFRVARDYKTDE
jgi:formylglycine-generating enzyme required for sulfatase activity